MYFDHAATSPPSEGLIKALNKQIELSAYNPSSSHGKGLELRRALELVREDLADYLAVDREEIFFLSGATEANNLVLQGLSKTSGGHVVSSAVEHDSVEKTLSYLEGQGIEVTRLAPDKLTIQGVLEALREDTFLVSLILVQNEIGDIYPLEGLGRELKKRKILYHRDLVQALGKVSFSLREEEIDLASFSSHKLGGLKGLGMLYKKRGVKLAPLIYGGDQEEGLRPGTENTLAILALGEVIRQLKTLDSSDIKGKNLLMRRGLEKLGARIISGEDASPYILAVSFPLPSEIMLNALSMKGVCVSAGSACHARSRREARINKFLERDQARGMLRLSISDRTSYQEIEAMLAVVEETLEELKRYI